VAAEYCPAKECGNILEKEELQKLIGWGRSSALSTEDNAK
jgi:hypothetical protein